MAKEQHQLKTYEDDYHIILNALVERLPLGYLKWSYVNEIPSIDYTLILDSILKGVKKHITEESESIFAETKTKISAYLNTFEVAPNESIDEFKLVFFISMTLAESLISKGLQREAKIVLSSMIWILDFKLSTVNAMRNTLTRQIIKMIERNSLIEETGKYGIYLTYKCLYNQAENK